MDTVYSRAELESKTDSELQQIAMLLGLPLTAESATTNDYIEAIMEYRPRNSTGESGKRTPGLSKDKPVKAKASSGRVRIIVHNTDSQDTAKFIKPMINGVMYSIPKEVAVDVPVEVLSVLDTAVMTAMRQVDGEMISTEVRRYPYTNLGPV